MWSYKRIDAVAARRFVKVFPACGGQFIYYLSSQACFCARIEIADGSAGDLKGLQIYGNGLTVETAYRDAEENLRKLKKGIDSASTCKRSGRNDVVPFTRSKSDDTKNGKSV